MINVSQSSSSLSCSSSSSLESTCSFEFDVEKNHPDPHFSSYHTKNSQDLYNSYNYKNKYNNTYRRKLSASPIWQYFKSISISLFSYCSKFCRLKIVVRIMFLYVTLLGLGILCSYFSDTISIQSSSWLATVLETVNPIKSQPFPINTTSTTTEIPEYSLSLGIDLLAANPAEYQFNWAHWINLTDQLVYKANGYTGPIKPLTRQVNRFISSGYFDKPLRVVLGADEDIRWIGRSYLAYYAPSPTRILFLVGGNGDGDWGKDEYPWNVDTSSDDLFYEFGQNVNPLLNKELSQYAKRHFTPGSRNTSLATVSVSATEDSVSQSSSLLEQSGIPATATDIQITEYDINHFQYITPPPSVNITQPTQSPKPNSKRKAKRPPQPDPFVVQFLKELNLAQGQQQETGKIQKFPKSRKVQNENIHQAIDAALHSKAQKFNSVKPYPSFNNKKAWNKNLNPNVILTPKTRNILSITQSFNKTDTEKFEKQKLSKLFFSRFAQLFGIAFRQNYNQVKDLEVQTFQELVRRVSVSIDSSNELEPLYDQLTPQIPVPNSNSASSSGSKKVFDLALNITSSRVLLTDPKIDQNFHFFPKDHTTKYYASLLCNETSSNDKTNTFCNSSSLTSVSNIIPDPSLENLFHAKSVLTQLESISNSSKHFHEVAIRVNGVAKFKHADWRFFQKQLTLSENSVVLHRMFRAWSRFCVQEGVISWLAHGTLLGWYWNGMSMPYDEDMDLQMPIAELDRLARKYNNTLVIDDEGKEGEKGRYLLQVAPQYVERRRGNGNNVIDGRFVDLETGAYIDLTGLSQSHESEPKSRAKLNLGLKNPKENQNSKTFSSSSNSKVNETYGCKNNHFYSESQLFPLRMTLFEGAPVYIPNQFKQILKDEYPNYDKPVFKQYQFAEDLRLWVRRDECREKLWFLNKYYTLINNHNDNMVPLSNTKSITSNNSTSGPQLSLNEALYDRLKETRFCGKHDVEDYYQRTKKLTMMHKMELQVLEDVTRNGTRALGNIDENGRKRLAKFGLRQPACL